jgi:hypothetical protein
MPQAAIKARPAKFAPDPERRVLIAKVHVAKKEMQLLDDDYRAMLIQVTGARARPTAPCPSSGR